MIQLQRVESHSSIMPKIMTVKLLRAMRRGDFVARMFSNYKRGMGEHLLHDKQMHSRRKSI